MYRPLSRQFPGASRISPWLVCAVLATVLLGLLLGNGQTPAAAEQAPWQLPGWRYRVPVQVYNTTVVDKTGVVMSLDDFPFLTLINDGKLAKDARDLRLLNSAGQVVPLRADFLLNDEGRASLVFYVREAPAGESVNYWLYYGNPQAPPIAGLEAHELVKLLDGLGAGYGAEQCLTPEPAAAADAKTRWLADFRLIEAQAGTVEGAASLVEPRRSLTDGLSGSAYAGFSKTGRGTLTFTADVEAGETACWVRYCPSTVNQATQGKLTVAISQDGKRLAAATLDLRAKANEALPGPGADLEFGDDMKQMLLDDARQEVERIAYRWQPLRATFAAGTATITITGEKTQAGVDCLLLTKHFAYQPDARDFKGRVWLRWRLTAPTGKIYTNINNQIRYGRHGGVWQPTGDVGSFGLRPAQKRFAPPADAAQYLPAGEFSPWVLLPTSTFNSWFTMLTFAAPPDAPLAKNAPVELQFANRPSPTHIFHITHDEEIERWAVKVRMPTETTLAGLRVLETFGDWARRRLAIIEDLKLGPPPRLQRLRVGTAFTNTVTAETSEQGVDREFRIMEALGINSPIALQLSDEDYARFAKKYDFITSMCYARQYPKANAPSTWKGDADLNEWFARMIAKPFAEFSDNFKKSRPYLAATTTHLDIGDEIGPAIDAKGILASPPVLQDFRAFLQQRGFTPQTFGMTTWEDVNPLDERKLLGQTKPKRKRDDFDMPPDDPDIAIDPAAGLLEVTYPPEKSLAAAKLFYYTRRYIDYYTGRYFRSGTDVLAREFPHHRIISPNYQAGPMQMAFLGNNNDTDRGLLDIFYLSREHVFRGLQVEDWVTGREHGIGRECFAAEIMRSAARKHNDELCALQVGGESIKHEMFAFLMHGIKELRSYLYGPLQNIGPAWGEYPHANAAMAQFTREIKPFEDAIADGAMRPRKAAMLVAYTSEVMQVNGLYHCRLRQNSYIALAHGYVPMDVVSEQEILEDDILQHYALLYLTDPQAPLAVHKKIADWVKEGGRVWAGAGGLNWDEFNQRCTVLDAVFGVAKRELVELPDTDDKQPPAGAVITADSPLFGGQVTLPVWDFILDCQPTTAQVLGSYADGKPAILLNKYGKGEAMLVGAPVGASYLRTHYQSDITDPEWTFARGEEATRILSGLVASAKVERPVVLDTPGIFTTVMDAPQGTLVFLNNATYSGLWRVTERRPAPQITARIQTPGPVKQVIAKHGALPFTQEGNVVTVQLSLPDTDILWLK